MKTLISKWVRKPKLTLAVLLKWMVKCLFLVDIMIGWIPGFEIGIIIRSPNLGLRKWNIYVQIDCQLSYPMMLISNGICQYERKYSLTKIYAIFWNHHRASFPEKIQSTEIYTNTATLRSRFFRKTRSVMVPRFDFFLGFTDKG